MSRPILMTRIQRFRIICNDCGELHEENSWIKARRWLPKHRKQCPLYQIFQKSFGIGRRKGGMIECPICHISRYLPLEYIKTSKKRNANYPELFGIHRSCRMKVIRPARKKEIKEVAGNLVEEPELGGTLAEAIKEVKDG